MARKNIRRGAIITTHLIKCGGKCCDKSTSCFIGDKDAAILEFIARGWRLTGAGWVCSECAGAIADNPETLLPDLKNLIYRRLISLRSEVESEIAAAKLTGNAGVLSDLMFKLSFIKAELTERNQRAEKEFTIYS